MEILPRGSFADQILRPWGQVQDGDRTRAWATTIVLGVVSAGLIQASCGLYAGMRWLLGKQVSPVEPSEHKAITEPARRALEPPERAGETHEGKEDPLFRLSIGKTFEPEVPTKEDEEELAESSTSSQPPDIQEEIEVPGPEREVQIAPPLPEEHLRESKRERAAHPLTAT